MANDYTSLYSGQQIDDLLGRVSTAEGNISSLSSSVSALDSAVTNKVDKVSGKGLSSADFTSAEKSKLAGLPTGLEITNALAGKANAGETSSLNTRVTAIEGKVPSAATSSNQLADKAFVTSGLAQKASTSSVSDLETRMGNAESALTNKVDKVSGKGLSTNDYTTADKTKLSGINAGAQENVIESVKIGGTALDVIGKEVNIELITNSEIDALFA